MNAQIVSFRCVLSNKLGNIISTTFNRDVITYMGGDGGLLLGLVEGLQDLRQGEKRRIALSADRAYGLYDPKLFMEVSRRHFLGGRKVSMGDQIPARAHDGRSVVYRVVRIVGDDVTLDANHPLAGQDLVFDIEALEARQATSQEIAEATPSPEGRLLH